MNEHLSKEDILDKAIEEFVERTGKLVPTICTDIDALKLLMQSVIKFSFVYKDIVWTNKLRLLKVDLSKSIESMEEGSVELLCNWNPFFKKEVNEVIQPIITKHKQSSTNNKTKHTETK